MMPSLHQVIIICFTVASSLVQGHSLVGSHHVDIIAHGGVAILPNWLPETLANDMRRDARVLFDAGYFTPDGLTNTALAKDQQGFSPRADRQTFRGGDGWDDVSAGDHGTRSEFANRMTTLRLELAHGLNRPTMGLEGQGGSDRNHEMTYNWYEPGAKLGRHLDEHHEETKGPKGWQMPTRRSITWLVYLNDGWTKEDGGILHCFSRQSRSSAPVGAHEGNLQVGWIDHVNPVFLESWREESGLSALYTLTSDKGPLVERKYFTAGDFDMPHQPIKFQTFLRQEYQQGSRFEQISTARRDPRFFDSTQPLVSSSASTENESYPVHICNVVPAAGTLVLFDSVTLPHLVGEVTGPRQRIAATGWFHEDNQALPF